MNLGGLTKKLQKLLAQEGPDTEVLVSVTGKRKVSIGRLSNVDLLTPRQNEDSDQEVIIESTELE